jgi:hypothetical protein
VNPIILEFPARNCKRCSFLRPNASALVLQPAGRGGSAPPVPVTVYASHGDGTFAAPITAGDFNGDGVTDIAVATTGRFSPYPVAVHVLLSQCE